MKSETMKKLWCAARDAGIDNDMVHDIIMTDYGKSSVKDLTEKEAISLIDVLSGKRKTSGVTIRQIWKINKLGSELGWDEKRLKGFIERAGGVKNIYWLSAFHASKVIEGLKAIIARNEESGMRS